MENSPENCNVKVALHIRPLLRHESQNGGRECLDVVPGTAQVLMGSHSFIFDHVYGGGGSPSKNMFQECAVPLLDALFQGYNGTIIAYGQTGSGKTYTMGTSPKESSHTGLMFQVMNIIFDKIQKLQHESEFQLHVSFIEILKEEVRDLLESGITNGNPDNKHPLQIRKASDGALSLSGSTEVSVSTHKEMSACLEQGCLNRSVASTDMNNQSSRSHAIFTIILEQKDKNKDETSSSGLVMSEEYRCAKLHLVDLAGSERAKRAGSEGVRLKEGIQINKGLLALGNVISALGDDKKRKEGLHIPYRDSKLTRLLQASLGGNCKTVMIACVSPADYNAEETLNTLKYANRARNIQNKASIQKEVFPADTHKLRQQLRLLQAELSHRKEAELVEVQDLKRKIDRLEATNSELVEKMNEYHSKSARVEATNSELVQKMNEYRSEYAFVEVSNSELVQKTNDYRSKCVVVDLHDTDANPEMKLRGSPDVEARERQSREKIIALEEDKRSLQIERDRLREEIARLEAAEVQTMNAQNPEITDLEAKHEQEIELVKQKCHDAKKRLQDELRGIKSQKVQLQQKVKQDEEQYRQWKADHEKQMLQLKKDSRKSEVELQKLQALYQRQAQVLQRKTEEAERATKKLKELLKSQKLTTKQTIRRETTGQPRGQNRSGQIKTLKRWLDNELDKLMHVYKLRMDHENRTLSHAKLKEDLSFLKQQDRASSRGRPAPQRGPSLSPNTRAVRIVSLESKVKSSTEALSKLSSQIQEAGRGHDPASAGRWKALHSLGDAKELLQHLFSIAIEARRRLLEKEYEAKDRHAGSTQTASIQKSSSLTNKLKEIEERGVKTARDKTPSKRSKGLELQPLTIGSAPLKGRATTSLDIFADMGLESPLPFPESRQLDSKAGICNRPLKVAFKQTQKMIPMAHVSMKKLPLGEQKGKISRWRRSHDEWLIQFKWKWQKPWKLSNLIKTSDQVRNSDDTLKGQDLSLRLGPTT
ncbi:putative plus-end-directed kinesin ATPase [Helianthus annuus]|uniref:kinesin-like protein KIN-4A n=1 Tax=Helianthus annuus TaxID=4232 RepID=UPI000B8F3EF4|nr:kinesin-like protein KIN-4A [Helianthus annuus]KAJ0452730.1 putative plus-end-directed kinesin ATPase [Helianthus annuus]KAJ0474640.1 putative plus-end-directed kinesin ATPase [Helianthus annuus]KAJ0650197.1 putative plus-end-directed kinesin ATPase [Helianthus annuus]KAJ0846569.1 putative plus-end-directed kinesin ATPase [Helianthus annuus]